MFKIEHIELLSELQALSLQGNSPLYLVGGVVRDIYLRLTVLEQDLDLIVEGNALEFGQLAKDVLDAQLKEFPDFLTCKLIAPNKYPSVKEVDFASARSEYYSKPGSLPQVKLAQIEEDLKRRDFSINSLALPLKAFLAWVKIQPLNLDRLHSDTLDLFNGRQDLEAGRIRILHPGSFIDDPTRIFRACRYAIRVSGKIEPETENQLRGAIQSGALKTVSVQRIWNEFKVIFTEAEPQRVLELLANYGVVDELGLFVDRANSALIEGFQKLASLKVPQELKGQVSFAIFYSLMDSKRDEIMLKSGIGKKRLALIKSNLEQSSDTGSPEKLSDEALLLAYTCRTYSSDIELELKKRAWV